MKSKYGIIMYLTIDCHALNFLGMLNVVYKHTHARVHAHTHTLNLSVAYMLL